MGAVRVRACACVASKTEVTVSCDLASVVTPHPFFLFLFMAATSLGAAHTRGEMITRQSPYREGRIDQIFALVVFVFEDGNGLPFEN